MLSKTFYAGGNFNGQDEVPTFTDSQSQPAAPIRGVGIEPWSDKNIAIVCVDIVFFQDADLVNYAFAGNSYTPDVMRWFGQPNPIPAGESFAFPAKSDDPPHIDCHVSGLSGHPFQLFYTVYYNEVD